MPYVFPINKYKVGPKNSYRWSDIEPLKVGLTPRKGYSYWKASCLPSMFSFRGVQPPLSRSNNASET